MGEVYRARGTLHNDDVSPDGNRFVFMKSQPVEQQPVPSLNLFMNWPAELRGAEGPKR